MENKVVESIDKALQSVLSSPPTKAQGDTLATLRTFEAQALKLKRDVSSHIGQIQSAIKNLK